MLLYNGNIFKRIPAIALFILANSWQVSVCQQTILDSTFTFRAGMMKTGNALSIISRQTGYNFTYDSRLINTDKKTEMTFNNERLNVILNNILKSDSLSYSVIGKYIIISKSIPPLIVLKIDSLPEKELKFISGIITDDESKESLPFATIALKNKGKGTVANSNGEFVLKIPRDCLSDTLFVSYLGYVGREIPVEQAIGNNFTIAMRKEFISIPEIIIRTKIPQEIIYKTLAAIPHNYGTTPSLLTGFYREGVLKKQELQVYSEAIIQIYKSAYSGSLLNDQIKVLKSRKIENTSLHDTLAVRLKAGLSTCMELDGARNIFDFMDRSNMSDYVYRMTDIVSFDDNSAYVIDFEQREGLDLPLYRGTIYINTDDFAIFQADFELHPKYIDKMKGSFISSSSRGFNTWPVTAKYSVSYRKIYDRYILNHVRGDLVFTSKRKRKLFNSQFHVFFELAVTNMSTVNVSRFDREDLAPVHSVFSSTITSYDSKFWENQDFLKPEDNLLEALKNMNVRLLEFSEPKQ